MLDAIDELIDETANDQTSFYDDFSDRCARCGGDWHGLPTPFCAGPFAEGEANEPARPPAAAAYDSAGPFIDQVIGATLRHAQDQARAEIARYAGLTVTPPLVMSPYPDEGSDVVGGHYVPFIGSGGCQCGHPEPEHDGECREWNRVFILPNDGMGVDISTLVGGLHQQLLDAVVEMIGEVCGIFLPDNNIERVIDTVREMTQARREERQRRDRIRCHLLSHDTAPPEGYTLADLQAMRTDLARHANNRREALQGLPSRRDNESPSSSDTGRRQAGTGTTVRNALPSVQEAQQDSSARAESDEGL